MNIKCLTTCFDEVFPNPTEELVQKGFAAYQSAECDYIIAFGGGSPIDTRKSGENPHRQPWPFHRLLRRPAK
ncbi:Lactaldehyde reductase [Salmonella enterica subsp. enterica]|uniref:Lactaldehyde reductase n=1 Tax=Salmonella enterica I TaxID=59201 RepID=A0A3S4HPY3_SALET|nr:Lactaldehyde reductase [Salmonella enterica subsp. enterica]